MKKDFLSLLGVIFLSLGVITEFLKYISNSMTGESSGFYIGYLFFLLAIYFFVKSFKIKEPTSWICQNCNTELVRKQIKFGLCPKCGVKVEGFRGLHVNSRYSDLQCL